MKKIAAFLVLWLGSISFVYFLYGESATSGEKTARNRLDSIVSVFGDRAYKAFYSIEEIRPFCIVQIDNALKLYGKNWLSPEKAVAALNPNDKERLLEKLSEFLEDFDNRATANRIIEKIVSWCKIDAQIEFINAKMGISKKEIWAAIKRANETGAYFPTKFFKEGSALANEEFSREREYYKAINALSALSFSRQLSYCGELFSELASETGK